MSTKCYILPMDTETSIAIQTIAIAIPCFISLNIDTQEYTITARAEDWCFIEKVLAPIV